MQDEGEGRGREIWWGGRVLAKEKKKKKKFKDGKSGKSGREGERRKREGGMQHQAIVMAFFLFPISAARHRVERKILKWATGSGDSGLLAAPISGFLYLFYSRAKGEGRFKQ